MVKGNIVMMQEMWQDARIAHVIPLYAATAASRGQCQMARKMMDALGTTIAMAQETAFQTAAAGMAFVLHLKQFHPARQIAVNGTY